VADRVRSYLIWGAGGHGRVVADLIRCTGHQVIGFVDRDTSRTGEVGEPGGARIVMTESTWIEAMHTGRHAYGFGALALGIGNNTRRYECLDLSNHMEMPVLIHPAASVSVSASLGSATVVLAGAVINAAARLGRGVIVNSGAIVEHDCVVGDAAHVSPGAVLCGGVQLGPRSWVGAAAVVVPNVRIGRDAIIGAGTVVLRDVPDGETVAGNPARALQAMSEAAP
jgi:sugar O-acyltransferase (sialic acid O-acetyltransferase NeuD family)